MKAILLIAAGCVCLGSAFADPDGPLFHHGAPLLHHAPVHHAPVHHAPVHHAPAYGHHEGPAPFAYEYGVQDHYSGADFAKKEIQDDYGVVTGEYRVALPDGRIQIVTYHADPVGGYVADVKYEGVPAYPAPGPHHGPAPVHHAPAAPFHHAPAFPHHLG